VCALAESETRTWGKPLQGGWTCEKGWGEKDDPERNEGGWPKKSVVGKEVRMGAMSAVRRGDIYAGFPDGVTVWVHSAGSGRVVEKLSERRPK